MNIQDAKIGLEIVRAKGGYVVGRVGYILDIDTENNRAQISYCSTVWRGSWVSFSVIEPTSIPYEIIRATTGIDRFGYPKHNHPKYRKL